MASKKLSTKSTKVESFNANTVYLKCLLYSPAGHGKTTMLGSSLDDVRFGRVLLLDFESGFGSIRSKVHTIYPDDIDSTVTETLIMATAEDSEAPADKIHRVKITTWADLQAVYNYLFDNPKVYNTVLIDSLSELNYLCINSIVKKAILGDPRHDKEIPELRDYLRSSVNMRDLVRGFRDLECHVVFTAISNVIQDEVSKKWKVKPSLSGKLAEEVPALVDTVGYLDIIPDPETKEEARFLWLTASERWAAKIRVEGIYEDTGLWDPSLPGLLDLVSGNNE